MKRYQDFVDGRLFDSQQAERDVSAGDFSSRPVSELAAATAVLGGRDGLSRDKREPRSVRPAIVRLLMGVIYTGVFQLGSYLYSDSYLTDEHFQVRAFVICFIYLSISFSYLFHLFLSLVQKLWQMDNYRTLRGWEPKAEAVGKVAIWG